jgi:hypothetical protein
MTLSEILDSLYDRHGELTPEIVRDEARPEDSPLHAHVFDREVGDAAEAYYLDRAHRLIQRCRVLMTTADGSEPRRVRAYFAVPSGKQSYTYEPQRVLISVPSKADAARLEAIRRVEQAQDSVEDLDLLLSSAGAPSPGPKRASKALKRAVKELAA